MKTIQIWEVIFKNTEKKYLEADGIDDAKQQAIDWSQIEFDERKDLAKKDKVEIDETDLADDYLIESLRVYVETDF